MPPLLSLRIEIEQLDNLRLPHHAGSMLRGAFGNALKKLACMTRLNDCKTCPLYRSCVYTQMFETPAPLHETGEPQQSVNPYVLQAPDMGERMVDAGEHWSFGMVLIGKAIDQLPIIAYAWQKACERGFGKNNSSASLLGIYQGEQCIYRPEQPLLPVQRTTLPPVTDGQQASLRFVTPLRLQHHNHIVLRPEQITAPMLLVNLAKRVQRLADIHSPQPVSLDIPHLLAAAEQIKLSAELRHISLTRYSNRQQQLMDFEGLVGDIHLSGDLTAFTELLAVGAVVGVGKSTTFGLGRYMLST